MTTLTKKNIELGLKIRCKEYPQWGDWTVKEKYAGGIWIIWGQSGMHRKVLPDTELRSWEIVEEK